MFWRKETVASYNLPVTSYKPQATSHKLKAKSHQLHATTHTLQPASHSPRAAGLVHVEEEGDRHGGEGGEKPGGCACGRGCRLYQDL